MSGLGGDTPSFIGNETEFVMQVKDWIEESASRTAELTRAQMQLELERSHKQLEERTRETVSEELTKWFGDIHPHTHASHHDEIKNWIDTRRQITTEIAKKISLWFVVALAAGAIAFQSSDLVVISTKDLPKPKSEAQSTTSVE